METPDRVRWFALVIFLELAGVLIGIASAHAQYTYVQPNMGGGYTMTTPGAQNPYTYVNPNIGGGYMAVTPGAQNPYTYVTPNNGGGYTVNTPSATTLHWIWPSR